MSFSYAQQTDYVDFKRVEALIVFNQLAIDSTTYNSYQVISIWLTLRILFI